MTSFSNVKFKRIFNLERVHKGQFAWKQKNTKMAAILELGVLLTLKLVMLCMSVTGQRCQSVHLMDIQQMSKGKSSYKFHVDKLVKQSEPGKPQPVPILPSYPVDKRLCVTTYFKRSI